jgi:hypothetical protein
MPPAPAAGKTHALQFTGHLAPNLVREKIPGTLLFFFNGNDFRGRVYLIKKPIIMHHKYTGGLSPVGGRELLPCGSGTLPAGLAAPKIIIQADNIIFFQVWTGLDLNNFQGRRARILQAMWSFDRYINTLIGSDL